MEWALIIILIIIAFTVYDIREKILKDIVYKKAIDLDYPYYSAKDVWIAQMEMETARKSWDEKRKIRDEYCEKNQEEIDKVKKNEDHSKEFKEIMRTYYFCADRLREKAEMFHHMLEANYAIRNGMKTFNQVSDEGDKMIGKHHKSSYHSWLEYEHKD